MIRVVVGDEALLDGLDALMSATFLEPILTTTSLRVSNWGPSADLQRTLADAAGGLVRIPGLPAERGCDHSGLGNV